MVGGGLEPRGPVNWGSDDGELAQLLQILTSMDMNWRRKEGGNDCHWEGRVIDINIHSYLNRAHVDETFALSIHLNLALNCFCTSWHVCSSIPFVLVLGHRCGSFRDFEDAQDVGACDNDIVERALIRMGIRSRG